jgi:hypothetical protein
MAHQPHASRAGCGGGGRGGRGGRFPKRKEPSSLPFKGGEVGGSKDLEGNVFTIKGKDGDMLRTSKEKLALYISTNYGDDACQEWLSEKQLVLQEPTYPDAVGMKLVNGEGNEIIIMPEDFKHFWQKVKFTSSSMS